MDSQNIRTTAKLKSIVNNGPSFEEKPKYARKRQHRNSLIGPSLNNLDGGNNDESSSSIIHNATDDNAK